MMHRSFSFAMAAERSRYKERLEATLAGLCELEMLKQRQESLVLSALSLGDSGPGCAWPLIRHCFPSSADLQQEEPGSAKEQGLMAVLQQQVGEMRVDTETSLVEHLTDAEDSGPSSGFCEQRERHLPLDSGDLSSRTTFPIQTPSSSERIKSAGETFVTSCDGLQDCGGSVGRSPVPCSHSISQSPLMVLSKRGGEGQCPLWPESNGAADEDESTPVDYHQAQHVETYILELIQRRLLVTRQCKPRTNKSPEARGIMRQGSLCHKEPVFISDHSKVSSNTERPTWASYNLEELQLGSFSPLEQLSTHYPRLEEKKSTHFPMPEEQHSTHYPRSEEKLSTQYPRPALAGNHSTSLEFAPGDLDPSSSEADTSAQHYQLPHSPSSEEQLVNAQYIPAQPCQAPMRAKTSRAHVAPKTSRCGTYSPERSQPKPRAIPKKCRFSEERTAAKKPGRKACRSQSENSLLGQKGVPERKYSTVERDISRANQSKSRRQQGTLGHRRWRSTLELSQDEAEPTPERDVRRTRRSRPAPSTYVYNQTHQHLHPHHPHHYPHPHLHSDYPLHSVCRPEGGYKQSGPGEWESSLSEGESPGSSSMSSDSDESGGLVWPQQLAPPLAPPSPPTTSGAPLQSKALVKIKASHALKKKILRFRTGSLKVMTTV